MIFQIGFQVQHELLPIFKNTAEILIKTAVSFRIRKEPQKFLPCDANKNNRGSKSGAKII